MERRMMSCFANWMFHGLVNSGWPYQNCIKLGNCINLNNNIQLKQIVNGNDYDDGIMPMVMYSDNSNSNDDNAHV